MDSFKNLYIFLLSEIYFFVDNEVEVFIVGYMFIVKFRSIGKGGGVGVYFFMFVFFYRWMDLEDEDIECIWIEIYF